MMHQIIFDMETQHVWPDKLSIQMDGLCGQVWASSKRLNRMDPLFYAEHILFHKSIIRLHTIVFMVHCSIYNKCVPIAWCLDHFPMKSACQISD